jgi:hypothetical protein
MKVVDERSGTIGEELERIVEFLRTEEAQQMILSELERLPRTFRRADIASRAAHPLDHSLFQEVLHPGLDEVGQRLFTVDKIGDEEVLRGEGSGSLLSDLLKKPQEFGVLDR